MTLEEFSNKLYESKILHDYKDGKVDYRKVHDWIVSQKEAINYTRCCTEFFCEDEDLGYQTEKCTKQCDGCGFIEKRLVK